MLSLIVYANLCEWDHYKENHVLSGHAYENSIFGVFACEELIYINSYKLSKMRDNLPKFSEMLHSWETSWHFFKIVTYEIMPPLLLALLWLSYRHGLFGKLHEIKVLQCTLLIPIGFVLTHQLGQKHYKTPLVKLHALKRHSLCTCRRCITFHSFTMLAL